ncbi:hypothetical protein M569_02948, partial [Genlisea aurea]
GDSHLILGPMFAGKTSTLLKRRKTDRDLCYTGRLKEAILILCCTGSQFDSDTYSLLLQECINHKEYKRGRRIHSQMVIVGFTPDEYLKIKLLILYAKAGDLSTARAIFDDLEAKTMIPWNAMIAGYVQKGMEEFGLSVYRRMRRFGLMPDQYTFASVFRACSSLAILEQGRQAHCTLIKSRVIGNVVVNSALMDMYFKCSSLSDGHRVFDKSLDRNVVTWTSLICGYGLHGRVSQVLESFSRMTDEGFKPNGVTFLAVLTACSHGGLIEEGKRYFSSMTRDYGVSPEGRHYAAMVDLLGRSGKIEEAYSFLRTSPSKEHPTLWGALLGACKLHGNVEMLNLAAKNFFELKPPEAAAAAGKYVVLSNAYANFGLWRNVSEIRRAMKGLGIKKDPGFSMIEVQKEVHFFFMAHNSHREIERILDLLLDLSRTLMRDVGDVVD